MKHNRGEHINVPAELVDEIESFLSHFPSTLRHRTFREPLIERARLLLALSDEDLRTIVDAIGEDEGGSVGDSRAVLANYRNRRQNSVVAKMILKYRSQKNRLPK